ncbi:MAG: hypothetical protein PHG23_02190 [Candidatus Pacebacteria bacterium]|nr:hypothetical protein [Candidatus Paceibacterota bacterium]
MLINLSTGSIYKWNGDVGAFLALCKKMKLDGLELMRSDKKSLDNFTLSGSDLEELKAFKYMSIHAPFRIADNSADDAEILSQLSAIESLYKKVNAKAVVFHATSLPRLDLLKKFDFKFIIENTYRGGGIGIDDFEKIVGEYGSDVCLDVSHAYTWSEKESLFYATRFKGKIAEIHLSASNGEHEHPPFSEASPEFLKSIEFLKGTDIPIIMESDYNSKDEETLTKDITSIKEFFIK